MLSQISQENQAHAHRMLQFLMVAIRPLRVEELAELLAFEFDVTQQGGIPKYRAAWRLDDQTQAVLSTCSSLIIVDQLSYGQIVHFSHFSVKEFLMSSRLTSWLGNSSRYHIRPKPAHTILAQACLGFLLSPIDEESVTGFPLAKYAARHWVEHAQYEDVASRVKDGMQILFDSDKPYFTAWIGIFDMDMPNAHEWNYSDLEISPEPKPTPLYYSVLCGFYDLVEHLTTKHPQHVNAICGQYRFPLFAALSKDHVAVAELLLRYGADINVRDTTGETILLMALTRPRHNLVSMVEFLLEHGADVNARDDSLRTPLHLAVYGSKLEVAQILIKHRANIDYQDNSGKTPLHILLEHRMLKENDVLNHALFLLERGADVNRRDKDNQTPLLLAMGRNWFKLAWILLKHGADANGENSNGKTPLHIISECQIHDKGVVGDILHTKLWLEHGTVVNKRYNAAPLLLEIGTKSYKFVWNPLSKFNADTTSENKIRETSVHQVSQVQYDFRERGVGNAQLSLERGVDFNAQEKIDMLPSYLWSNFGPVQIVQALLDHGASVNTRNNGGETSPYLESEGEYHNQRGSLDV